VTTSAAAEQRILIAAERAWTRFGRKRLPVFVTTLERIAAQKCGMVASIWRRP
jgi:hypothetical protein